MGIFQADMEYKMEYDKPEATTTTTLDKRNIKSNVGPIDTPSNETHEELKSSPTIPITRGRGEAGAGAGVGAGLSVSTPGKPVVAEKVIPDEMSTTIKLLGELQNKYATLVKEEDKIILKVEINAMRDRLKALNDASTSQNEAHSIVKQRAVGLATRMADPESDVSDADVAKYMAYNSFLQTASRSQTEEARANASDTLKDALASLASVYAGMDTEPKRLKDPKDIIKKQMIATAVAQGASVIAGLFGGDIGLGARGAVAAGEAGAALMVAKEREIDTANQKYYELFMKTKRATIKDYSTNMTSLLKQHMKSINVLDSRRIEEVSDIWASEKKSEYEVKKTALEQSRLALDTAYQEKKISQKDYEIEIAKKKEELIGLKYKYAILEGNADRILDADKENAKTTKLSMRLNAQHAKSMNAKLGKKKIAQFKHAWMFLPSLNIIGTSYVELTDSPRTAASMSNAIAKASKLTAGYKNIINSEKYTVFKMKQSSAVLDRSVQLRNYLIDTYTFAQNNSKAVQFNGNANQYDALATDIGNAMDPGTGRLFKQVIHKTEAGSKHLVTYVPFKNDAEKVAFMFDVGVMIERLSKDIDEADGAAHNRVSVAKDQLLTDATMDTASYLYDNGEKGESFDRVRDNNLLPGGKTISDDVAETMILQYKKNKIEEENKR